MTTKRKETPVGSALSTFDVPIDSVTPYERNPRQNDKAVAKVAASIQEFGFRQPIVVDDDMVVLVGHTRLRAARELKLATVPVHVAHGLTPEQCRAYRIADNRVAQESTWDAELLKLELTELKELEYDMTLTGFTAKDFEKMFSGGHENHSINADKHLVIVELETEAECSKLYEELSTRGLSCKLMS